MRLGRRVAVKLLSISAVGDATRGRFLREARAAVGFTHPHAVAVYDAGQDGHTLYLVMELVEGPTLAEVLAERRALDPGEAVAIADQVLAALAAGHGAGLVHRDIKPSNILVTNEGVVKLADFGIAKSLAEVGATITATGEVVGTPRYLSPEQIWGGTATPASDIYSVGVVLFEMLAGTAPLTGATALATALAHRDAPVPSLRAIRPQIGAGLAACVERALAKSPEDRYASVDDFRAALAHPGKRGMDTTTVLPSPTPVRRDRIPAVFRRSRNPVLLTVVVLAAAALAAAAAIRWAEREGDLVLSAPLRTTVPAPPSSAPTTTAPTTTTLPGSIGALTDRLAGTAGAMGEKGPDLLDKLQKVQRETGPKQREEAEKAIEDIRKWVADGGLDPHIGRVAIAVLEPVVTSAGAGGTADGEG